jgi:D-glycero-D-manno-heptose 1,7-bisphosphate phosphatase
MGERVVVVTNQSVVGRGMISETELVSIHDRMTREVERAGGRIASIYACLHSPEHGCGCRKPATGLLTRAAVELGVRLQESVIVGDTPSDMQCARAAGCKGIFVGDSPPAEPIGYAMWARSLEEAVTLLSRLRFGRTAAC